MKPLQSCLYGFIEIFVIAKGICRYSAAVLYIRPFIPLLLTGFTYLRNVFQDRKTGRGKTALFLRVSMKAATGRSIRYPWI